MKISPLLPQVALVVAIAYACADSMAPASSRSLVAPTGVDGVIGKPPPPPVSTVIAVTISSHISRAIFTGVFFNNGLIHDDGTGVTETFDGTAWLRFDNQQPPPPGGAFFFSSAAASANTRFMVKDLNPPTGHGTLTIGGVDYKIVSVENFTRFAGCGAPEETEETPPPSPCASIQFTASAEGDVCIIGGDESGCHRGNLVAFEKSECLVDSEGAFYDCAVPPPIGSGD